MNEIEEKIAELYNTWYHRIMFDSTGTWGHKEREELIIYSKEHINEFQNVMTEFLSHPAEACNRIPEICVNVFPDEIVNKVDKPMSEEELASWIEKLQALGTKIIDITEDSFFGGENAIWEPCNKWLNYFKGTENIDYYKEFKTFKKYLHNNYKGWNPFKEEDPNPSYEDFVNNKEKYK